MRSSRLMITTALALCLLVTLSALPSATTLHAQAQPVTISLAIPSSASDIITPKMLGDFESANPGVKVSIVKTDVNIPEPALGLDKHFQAVQNYASAADVLYVGNTTIAAEDTRAGYYLDLAPLVSIDKTLNTDDFFPTIWQAYQWDRGIWALPIGADTYVLTYNPDAFDKAKLAYPDAHWTIDDLSNAIRKLTVKDADGKVTQPGMDVLPFTLAYLFRGVVSGSLIDSSNVPDNPKFATPEVATLLDAWLKLDNEGLIGTDFNKAPLSIAPVVTIAIQGQIAPGEKRAGALMPGGKAILAAQGFAVSGGTQYPEQAYALAAWLTTRAEIVTSATTPARKSMVGKSDSTAQVFQLNVTPDMQALIDQSITNAIPTSELRYLDYLALAYNQMKTTKVDATTAIQQAENTALADQRTAASQKDKLKNTLVVATPIPSGGLAAGKSALKFGIDTGFAQQGLPNKDAWNKLAADFPASDPTVGQVTIESSSLTIDTASAKYDCFYLPYNAVSADKLSKLLPLDPLLGADTTFDKSDMLGSVMTQVQLDNKTWALPSDIAPDILKFDPTQFNNAGVAVPGLEWTTSQFADALKQLKPDASATAPFIPQNTFGSYLFPLIAAYGGLPIDYRTTPPTVNFTDPATVDAIRQVADLAKNGYIKYHSLFGAQLDVVLVPEKATVLHSTLGAFAFKSPFDVTKLDTYKLTLYPRGTTYNGISYAIGTLYISATATNPEGCYRWISQVARTPALFTGMPARHSLINDPALVSAQGADTVAVYKQIETLLQDPKTVSFPSFSQGTSYTTLVLEIELFKVLDNYIQKDANLDNGLKDANDAANAYLACSTSLPPYDTSSADSQKVFFKAFKDCAVKADPALAAFFSGLNLN